MATVAPSPALRSRRKVRLRIFGSEALPPHPQTIMTVNLSESVVTLLSFADVAAMQEWERPSNDECRLLPGFGILWIRAPRDASETSDILDVLKQARETFWDDVAQHKTSPASC